MMINTAAAAANPFARTESASSPYKVEEGIAVGQVKHLKPSEGPRPGISMAPVFQAAEAMREALQTLDVADFASNQPFAEVYKNGKLVARIDNGGGVTTYGAADGIITGRDDPSTSGPELAQWRADKIAKAMGGEVRIADTAQTQSEWATSYAREQALIEQARAPYLAAMAAYRAAMDAHSAQMDAWRTQASSTTDAAA